jgi:hypothetical protein
MTARATTRARATRAVDADADARDVEGAGVARRVARDGCMTLEDARGSGGILCALSDEGRRHFPTREGGMFVTRATVTMPTTAATATTSACGLAAWRGRRPDARVRAKKGGAFLREFGPEDEKKKSGGEADESGGFPALVKQEGVEPFSVNLMVKKQGPLNMVWNGVGTLQVPDAGEKTASVNLCRLCLAQRSELLIENFERLYPKLKNEALEWALQPFDDPYGDKFDPFMVVPEDQATEFVPGNLQFLKKPRRVAPGQ